MHIVEWLQNRINVPAFPQNDANACALAEWQFGAGRGCKNMVFLTFGTGMGAGLILDGRLYAGTNDMAGEAGHMRLAPDGPEGYGKRGSFEGFCSGGGIRQLAQMELGKDLSCKQVCASWPTRATRTRGACWKRAPIIWDARWRCLSTYSTPSA